MKALISKQNKLKHMNVQLYLLRKIKIISFKYACFTYIFFYIDLADEFVAYFKKFT